MVSGEKLQYAKRIKELEQELERYKEMIREIDSIANCTVRMDREIINDIIAIIPVEEGKREHQKRKDIII